MQLFSQMYYFCYSKSTWPLAIRIQLLALLMAFSLYQFCKVHQKQFSLTWLGQQYTVRILPKGYGRSVAHNVVLAVLTFHKASHEFTSI